MSHRPLTPRVMPGSAQGTPPIIIIGMHRSGTTLLTSMLDQLGLFTGVRKDDNGEALFFVMRNDWLLRQCGATWESPEGIAYALADADTRAEAISYLRGTLQAPRVVTYLGRPLFLRARTPANLDIPWGWKDPRTTYTLPLWLDVFPDAKVIHIMRHGVDVAASLRRREERLNAALRLQRLNRWRQPMYWVQPGQWDMSYKLCTLPLARGLSLWESYVQRARDHVQDLGERACEVRYEDLLADPEPILRVLAPFCGLTTTVEHIALVARTVHRERAYAYRRDPDLQRFARGVVPRLHLFDYDAEAPEGYRPVEKERVVR